MKNYNPTIPQPLPPIHNDNNIVSIPPPPHDYPKINRTDNPSI
jgi:hypothetical protein